MNDKEMMTKAVEIVESMYSPEIADDVISSRENHVAFIRNITGDDPDDIIACFTVALYNYNNNLCKVLGIDEVQTFSTIGDRMRMLLNAANSDNPLAVILDMIAKRLGDLGDVPVGEPVKGEGGYL